MKKTTNSYSPSKACKEWRNIPLPPAPPPQAVSQRLVASAHLPQLTPLVLNVKFEVVIEFFDVFLLIVPLDPAAGCIAPENLKIKIC